MERLATAEWADPAEFANRCAYREGTFWLGRSPPDGASLGHIDDRHIMLTSGTRSGKGTTTIVNNLCLWPGSVVVVDPKGENATVTAARRGDGSEYCEGMGQRVHVLDPFEASEVEDKYRSSFNPLDALDPNSDSVIDDADIIADALVVVNEKASEPEWQETARHMLKGLILHVLTAPRYEGRRDLITVRELIRRGDHELASERRPDDDGPPASPRQLLWEGVSRNQHFDGIIAGIGEHMVGLLLDAPKQFEGYHASLDLNTRFLDSPKMQGVLRSSGFDLAELKTDPDGVSLYLCLPNRYMTSHSRWLRLMVALVTAKMEEVRQQPASGHRVLMVLDEFAKLETMRSIEHAVSYIAGYGVTMLFVLQSLEQLKRYYRDGWETFVGNAGTKIFFSIDDQFTREYVAKLMGDTELIRSVRSSSTTSTQSRSTTIGYSTSRTEGSSTTEGQNESQSHTEGSGTSDTTGRSRNVSRTKSTSISEGVNRSRAFGLSHSSNQNQSSSVSQNRGGNRSTSKNEGESRERGWLFGRRTVNSGFGVSSGEQWGSGTSSSTGFGTSSGRNRTDSVGSSTNRSRSNSQTISEGTSQSHTVSQNQSDTTSSGWSTSMTSSESFTYADSTSNTTGYSEGQTQGESETVHKRPLMTPDELGIIFDRPSDGEVGLALIFLGGGRPAAAIRTPYFADDQFAWLHDPHPDHPLPLKMIGEEDFILELDLHPTIMTQGVLRGVLEVGRRVRRGDAAAVVELPRPELADEDQGAFQQLLISTGIEWKPSGLRVPILAPISSESVEDVVASQRLSPHPSPVATFRINRRRALLEAGQSIDATRHLTAYSRFLSARDARNARAAEDAAERQQRTASEQHHSKLRELTKRRDELRRQKDALPATDEGSNKQELWPAALIIIPIIVITRLAEEHRIAGFVVAGVIVLPAIVLLVRAVLEINRRQQEVERWNTTKGRELSRIEKEIEQLELNDRSSRALGHYQDSYLDLPLDPDDAPRSA